MIWTIAWIGWLVAFAVIEGLALLSRGPGSTLSEHVWDWFRVKGSKASWTVQRVLLLAGLIWLTGHLAFGWWPS